MKLRTFLILLFGLFFFISCSKVWHIADTKAERLEMSDIYTEDTAVSNMIAPFKKDLDKEMNLVLGVTEKELTKGSPESLLTNFLIDAIHKKTVDYHNSGFVQFSVQNSGGIRVPNLAKGEIKQRDIYELMPFDNMLVVLKLDGPTTLRLFEHMAKSGGWPVNSTVKYTIRGEQPVDITINGEPFDVNQTYYVGTSDYVANGGSDCDFLIGKERVELGRLVRDAIIEHISEVTSEGLTFNPELDGRVTVEGQ